MISSLLSLSCWGQLNLLQHLPKARFTFVRGNSPGRTGLGSLDRYKEVVICEGLKVDDLLVQI